MSSLCKKIIGSLVLASFLAIVLFSFVTMMHEPDESALSGCPFAAGVSLCPQDMVGMILHHISAYNSLFNVLINFNTNIFVILVLLALVLNMTAISYVRPLLLNPLFFQAGSD